jgi:hypothetical protein
MNRIDYNDLHLKDDKYDNCNKIFALGLMFHIVNKLDADNECFKVKLSNYKKLMIIFFFIATIKMVE